MKYAIEVLRMKSEALDDAIQTVRGGLGMVDAQRALISARHEINEAIALIEGYEAAEAVKAEAPTKREGKAKVAEPIRGASPSGRKRGRPAKSAPAEERTMPMAGVIGNVTGAALRAATGVDTPSLTTPPSDGFELDAPKLASLASGMAAEAE